ncbi:MAG: anthranilate synthase component I [Phormidesmis sp.]
MASAQAALVGLAGARRFGAVLVGSHSVWRRRLKLRPCERFFWRSLPLNQRTGSEIFAALFQPQTLQANEKGIATLLESPYPLPPDSLPEQATEMARYSICAGAPRVVNCQMQIWTPKIGQVLPLLEKMGQCRPAESSGEPPRDLPFMGGWLGWLGYDCAWEIERLPWLKEDLLPFPVAFWYEPSEFAVLDHHTQQLWLAAETAGRLATLALRSEKTSLYKEKSDACSGHTRDLTFQTEQAEFEAAVRRSQAHIKAGDVFQVNHSLRFQAQTTLPSWEVYKALHVINPSPFASYWHTPWGAVVSCSPERLVTLASGIAQSRPIAGTRSRGKTAATDRAAASELEGDRKEQAEHIMLVDLERNDLGRVCEWGSVQVAELMVIERYSHVMHLVSNVVGRLRGDRTAAQLIAALFPGGTITGCPKVRCMEIIEAIEPVRRSLFYGSCGYYDRRGRLDLNILIRTLLMSPALPIDIANQADEVRTVWGQVGAGVVADSQPEREWQESLQKAKAQLLALGL